MGGIHDAGSVRFDGVECVGVPVEGGFVFGCGDEEFGDAEQFFVQRLAVACLTDDVRKLREGDDGFLFTFPTASYKISQKEGYLCLCLTIPRSS